MFVNSQEKRKSAPQGDDESYPPNSRKLWGREKAREAVPSAQAQTVAQPFPGSRNPPGFLLQLLVRFKSAGGEGVPWRGGGLHSWVCPGSGGTVGLGAAFAPCPRTVVVVGLGGSSLPPSSVAEALRFAFSKYLASGRLQEKAD